MKYGMVIDLDRCIGCHACSLACKIENSTSKGIFWSRVFQLEDGVYPNVRRAFLPRLCMHCDNPVCITVCPTGATFKSSNGLVLVDENKCIGCKACMLACPYSVRYFNDGKQYFSGWVPPWGELPEGHREGTVGKCSFCSHRIEKGLDPACVEACPTRARIFGDLDDQESEVFQLIRGRRGFQLRPELDLRPCVHYLAPRGFTYTEAKD